MRKGQGRAARQGPGGAAGADKRYRTLASALFPRIEIRVFGRAGVHLRGHKTEHKIRMKGSQGPPYGMEGVTGASA